MRHANDCIPDLGHGAIRTEARGLIVTRGRCPRACGNISPVGRKMGLNCSIPDKRSHGHVTADHNREMAEKNSPFTSHDIDQRIANMQGVT
jgi:hypothetical protein